jgi:hypothetical protein
VVHAFAFPILAIPAILAIFLISVHLRKSAANVFAFPDLRFSPRLRVSAVKLFLFNQRSSA